MDGSQRGERLRLRFVRRSEVPLLNDRYAPDRGGFNDFGDAPGGGADPHQLAADGQHNTPEQRPAALAPAAPMPDRELRDDHGGQLWVERLDGGPPIGTVQYHQLRYGGNPESIAWMIGIDLLPEARGQGHGAEAQRLLAEWLFDNTPANRVEAQTDVENAAEARSLERAGFTREGILRGAQFRGGAYHDLIVYSRLRTDPR